MRNGYILLHRQGITPEEWKTPKRTLAWFDLLTMVDYQTGKVTFNYTFYERRWRTARSTIHKWIRYWEGERMCERTGEHDSERNGERLFIVNYAKYQKHGEQEGEQKGERKGEQKGEPRKKVNRIPSVEVNNNKSPTEIGTDVPPPEKPKGNSAVNTILTGLKETFGGMDGTDAKNRQFAWNLIKKIRKESKREEATDDDCAHWAVALMKAAKEDPWWQGRITRVQDMYYNLHKIINDVKRGRDGGNSKVAIIS